MKTYFNMAVRDLLKKLRNALSEDRKRNKDEIVDSIGLYCRKDTDINIAFIWKENVIARNKVKINATISRLLLVPGRDISIFDRFEP